MYRIRSREPSANACASDDHGEFIRPERVIHTEEDGRVMENVRSSKTAVEVLTKIGRYKSGMWLCCSLPFFLLVNDGTEEMFL